MTVVGIDTSVAIRLLVRSHPGHGEVMRWQRGRELALCGHALAETYSVLTRLPGDLRRPPEDAAGMLRERFGSPLLPKLATARALPDRLSRLGIAGGAVYDALVGLAAADHDADLATLDARARPTYEAVGARVVIAG
jgi:predicted nucleic acid-binding protein